MRRMQADVRVVLTSGYGSHELAARHGTEVLAEFIQKPFHVEELETCLTAVFGSAPSHVSSDGQPADAAH